MKNALTSRKQTGFTIVELLIVIVVIGILAAITIVAFNGIQQRARNTARAQEAKQWQTIFTAYRIDNGEYPLTTGGVCLGEGFPKYASSGNGAVGSCWDANLTSSRQFESTAFNDRIKTISSLPNANRTPILGANGTTLRVGPAAYISGSNTIIAYFQELNGSITCPHGTLAWQDAVSYRCDIYLPN